MITRQEQLEFCKVCENQEFDKNYGIICKLTNKKATFDFECESFVRNPNIETIEHDKEHYINKNLANRGKRLANHIIDLIIIYVVMLLIGLSLGIIFSILNINLLNIIDFNSRITNYIIGFVLSTTYYITFEAASGRTIAKYITKTKVVDLDGNKPNLEKIIIRSICRFIPFEALSFLGSDSIGWHDAASKTRVVEINTENDIPSIESI